jgi:predicted branched-subunit amino acid permease
MTASDVRTGLAAALPIVVATTPFGLVFGAIAVNTGLTTADAVLLSATVYAGASQMVSLDLFAQKVPAWAIILSVFAVNFRHVLYSATLTKIIRREGPLQKAVIFALLVDPQFALTAKRAQEGHPFSFAWYVALGLPIYANWLVMTAVGAQFGMLIGDPHALAVDLLLPIYFLALVMSFRGRGRWGLTVAVSAVVSTAVFYAPLAGLTFLGPPWHVTLGGLAGVLAAAALPPGPAPRTAPVGGTAAVGGAARQAEQRG